MKHILSTKKDSAAWAVTPWMTKWPTTTVSAARRRRWTAVEKAQVLRVLAASELSMSAFSRKAGVALSTLYQWQQHAERWQSEAAMPAFAEVQVAGSALGTTAFVHLPSGVRLEATVGTDPDWLAAIIKATVAS